MSFNSWMDYALFADKVKNGNRYIHDEEVTTFLSNTLKTGKAFERFIQLGTVFWRSQLGNASRPFEIGGRELGEELIPYPKERMKPLLYEANEGRANPKGIPFIYLASDKKTAMAEARPWRDATISLGSFKTLKKLKIVDLCIDQTNLNSYERLTKEEIVEVVWSGIGHSFSNPVTRNDAVADYVPTQIISELFKNDGYDGLAFKSALGEGYNLVLFDIDSVSLCTCHLYEVSQIDYSFKEFEAVSYSEKEE